MKKHFLFVALAAIFSLSMYAQEVAKPDTAMGVSGHESVDVMALYCNHFTENNLHYNVLGWGGVATWETLKLGADSTAVLYCQDMKWEIMASDPVQAYDFSGYDKLHFDVWVPEASHIKLTFETAAGLKPSCSFRLNEGWNTIDAEPAWWKDAEGNENDFKDVKFLIFEGYLKADSTSAENTPFAFANIYFWKKPAPQGMPAESAPKPTMAEEHVQALFSTTYQTNTFNFAPNNWSTQWIDYAYTNGEHIWFAEDFTWDGFTNWDTTRYAIAEDLDMLHADVYVTVDSKMKFTFEALSAGEGGSGWKQGLVVEGLKANQWNSVTIDLLNAPFDSYDFTDLRYMILEGFVKTDGSPAEHTPVAIANVYFYSSLYEAIDEVPFGNLPCTKVIRDGQLIIIRDGKMYNAQGAQY